MDHSDHSVIPLAFLAVGSGLIALLCYNRADNKRDQVKRFDRTPDFSTLRKTHQQQQRQHPSESDVKILAYLTPDNEKPLVVQDSDGMKHDAALVRISCNQVIFSKVTMEQKRKEISQQQQQQQNAGVQQQQQYHYAPHDQWNQPPQAAQRVVVDSTTTKSKDVALTKQIKPLCEYLVYRPNLLLMETPPPLSSSNLAKRLVNQLIPDHKKKTDAIIVENQDELLRFATGWTRVSEETTKSDPRVNRIRAAQLVETPSNQEDLKVSTQRERTTSQYDIEETSGGTKKIYYTLYKDILPFGSQLFVWGALRFDPVNQTFVMTHIWDVAPSEWNLRDKLNNSIWWSNFGAILFGLVSVGVAGFGIYRFSQRKKQK